MVDASSMKPYGLYMQRRLLTQPGRFACARSPDAMQSGSVRSTRDQQRNLPPPNFYAHFRNSSAHAREERKGARHVPGPPTRRASHSRSLWQSMMAVSTAARSRASTASSTSFSGHARSASVPSSMSRYGFWFLCVYVCACVCMCMCAEKERSNQYGRKAVVG